MKKISVLVLLGLLFLFSEAQNTWTQKANFPGTFRRYTFEFSIGTKGYVGGGESNTNADLADFWEYDQGTNTWTQKAGLNTGRSAPMGWTIGGKGYAVMGFNNGQLSDIWEYDPALNNWTQKANFPGAGRYAAACFTIGNKGYIGMGCPAGGNDPPSTDFWEYDPGTNVWTQKASSAMTPRWATVGFGIGTKGYMCLGYNGATTQFFNDLWEYDQATNSWLQKTNFPASARAYSATFMIGNRGFVGTGNDPSGYYNDFYEYNPQTNNWTQLANFGGNIRTGASAFTIGSKGYMGIGGGSSYYLDFWEYSPVMFASAASTNATCGSSCDGTATATANGGQSPFTYSWSNGQTTAIITGLCGGTYTVVITDASSATSTAIVTIAQPSVINAFASTVNPTVCSGSCTNVVINATGGVTPYTYLWQPGNLTGQFPNVCPTTTTAYTCTVTDANNCTQTASTTVTVSPPPAVTSSSTIAICMGDSANISASGANTYTWSPGNQMGSNIIVSPASTTTYTVTGANSAGCTGTSTTTVIVNNLPNVVYFQSPTNVCVNWQAFGLSSGSPSGGTYSGPGVNGINFDPAGAGVGMHTIIYSYTDINGCTNADTQQITVNACVGIFEDENILFDAVFFPNPAQDGLFITFSRPVSEATLIIYDAVGRPIRQGVFIPRSGSINIKDLEPGIYLLELITPNGSVVKKLVKE